jgi:CBS domain containing-hemolysin-like protein
MLLLVIYVLVALVFSFLCSIAEAVMLSVKTPYIVALEQEGRRSGTILSEFKKNIGKPLAAILTLNTIAHTVGAVGAGAQAAQVFGNAYLGVASAILTLLILVLSEIIPKTLGALHWRTLAPVTAHVLRVLILILYPFIWLSEKITGGLSEGVKMSGFSRQELAILADIGANEGQLTRRESEILKNLLLLRRIKVLEVMTPRKMMFSLASTSNVASVVEKHADVRFSRIPLFGEDQDMVDGFVLRADIIMAYARGDRDRSIAEFHRDLPALLETTSLAKAFNVLMPLEAHIAMVVDEYGGLQGIITLEDIFETLLGMEIVDEGDETADLRELAKKRWKRRAQELDVE